MNKNPFPGINEFNTFCETGMKKFNKISFLGLNDESSIKGLKFASHSESRDSC